MKTLTTLFFHLVRCLGNLLAGLLLMLEPAQNVQAIGVTLLVLSGAGISITLPVLRTLLDVFKNLQKQGRL